MLLRLLVLVHAIIIIVAVVVVIVHILISASGCAIVQTNPAQLSTTNSTML